MRSWFNDTEATRSTYRDATWFSGNFDSKQVDACGGAEVRSPSVDWSPYFVVEWRRRDLLAECVDTLYSDDSPSSTSRRRAPMWATSRAAGARRGKAGRST